MAEEINYELLNTSTVLPKYSDIFIQAHYFQAYFTITYVSKNNEATCKKVSFWGQRTKSQGLVQFFVAYSMLLIHVLMMLPTNACEKSTIFQNQTPSDKKIRLRFQ